MHSVKSRRRFIVISAVHYHTANNKQKINHILTTILHHLETNQTKIMNFNQSQVFLSIIELKTEHVLIGVVFA